MQEADDECLFLWESEFISIMSMVKEGKFTGDYKPCSSEKRESFLLFLTFQGISIVICISFWEKNNIKYFLNYICPFSHMINRCYLHWFCRIFISCVDYYEIEQFASML